MRGHHRSPKPSSGGSWLAPSAASRAARRPPRSGLRIVAATAILALGLIASAAEAQLGDVGETSGVDSDATPRAKDSERWAWVAGARYNPDGPTPADLPEESATPLELDFFDVSFYDTENGLAAGAECRDPLPAGADAEQTAEHLDSCERIPVIYRYTIDDLGNWSWDQVYRGETPGYVGAIEWIAPDRALAVGGDGVFPRRERRPSTVENDPAGAGRAWLMEGGQWRELAALPAGIRGMSALAVSPRNSDCGAGVKSECAVAGAFRQLWTFTDGAFTDVVTDQSPDSALDRSYLFQFRVRDIEFGESPGSGALGDVRAIAVTSGCCAADELTNGPWFLLYDGERWYVRQRERDLSNISDAFDQEANARSPRPFDDAWEQATAGSNYRNAQKTSETGPCISAPGLIAVPCTRDIYEQGYSQAGVPLIPPLGPEAGPWPLDGALSEDPDNPAADQTDPLDDQSAERHDELYRERNRELDVATSPYGANAGAPDSLYSIGRFQVSTSSYANAWIIATPGGPLPEAGTNEESEPASQLATVEVRLPRGKRGPNSNLPVASMDLLIESNQDKLFSTLRLHDLDTTPERMTVDESTFSTGIEAVGMLGRTGQGAAFGPQDRFPSRDPDGLHGCDELGDTSKLPPDCDPDAQRFVGAYGSRNVFKLPAYALNSVDVVDRITGAGWAVGDRGAILALAGSTAAQAQSKEPQPPRLGERTPAATADDGAYAEHKPAATDAPGLVRPLLLSPERLLREPGLVEAGIVPGREGVIFGRSEPAELIAMSRDGSEGWAFGRSSAYHYSLGEWRPCEPGNAELGAGVACDSLAPFEGLRIVDLERVPLERDSDPTNDDDFELTAIFELSAITADGLLRYRDGRWAREDAVYEGQFKGEDLAFVAPDDAWLADGPRTLHFDGERWVRCAGNQLGVACADPQRRLSVRLEDSIAGGVTERNQRGLRLAVAGDRIYAFGTRSIGGAGSVGFESYPMIIYRDPGGNWTGGLDDSDDGAYNPTDGGWDPARYIAGQDGERVVEPDSVNGTIDPTIDYGASKADQTAKGEDNAREQGRIFTVAVAPDGEGVEGWALGLFGGLDSTAEAAMMRLEDGRWSYWSPGDAVDEYLRDLGPDTALDPRLHLSFGPESGLRNSFIFQAGAPALTFNAEAQRWEGLATPWTGEAIFGDKQAAGRGTAAYPDGRGGFWLGVQQSGGCPLCGGQFAFYHYTDRAPEPVLSDVANPAGSALITAMATGAEGSLWLGDSDGALHRHDRLTGWQRGIRIPGWDPPRSTTRSGVTALAIGPNGHGIAVGPGGRIANVGPGGVGLNKAAGTACDFEAPIPPCSTGRDLSSAAISPDGAALLAGEPVALLWRPAGGDFRRIEPPRLPRGTEIVDVGLPRDDRAYLLTDRGQLLRGELREGSWRWSFELGSLAGADARVAGEEIADFEIGADGGGYAVGTGGLLLARRDDGSWRRIPSGVRDNFQALGLPSGGGKGALAGAEGGSIYTVGEDRLALVRPADLYDPVTSARREYGEVLGLGLAPGIDEGQIEAWAVLQAPAGSTAGSGNRLPRPQALLHHGSDAAEPLLDPTLGIEALPDESPPRPGEVAFAALGKQECRTIRKTPGTFGALLNANVPCPPTSSSNLSNELVARRVSDEVAERVKRPGGPGFAVFTGDIADGAGGGKPLLDGRDTPEFRSPIDPSAKQRRWVELFADPLARAGMPLAGAIGGQDLALHPELGLPNQRTDLYFGGNLSARQPAEAAGARAGLNLPWRETMAAMPAPWERELGTGTVAFERIEPGLGSQASPETETPGATAEGPTLSGSVVKPRVRVNRSSTAGAPTHYALDVLREGEPVARIVVTDSSLGSLAASNSIQHPSEAGGQERWLEDMLCIEGSLDDTGTEARNCTRPEGQPAIVVTNTPTYSYGPISPTETMTDATRFEEILLRQKATVVLSGRLGWNGLYWATAPGVHEPCPGQSYQSKPPAAGTRICGQDPSGTDAGEVASEVEQLADGTPLGVLPFVVSSTAGGHFNEGAERAGQTSAENGFWRGYSIVRLDPSGDPRKTIVEQRPVLDWVGLSSRELTVRPGRTVKLQGFAREAFGVDTVPRYFEISSPAITHRYELLAADPERPWIPLDADDGETDPAVNRCAPYRCLDTAIGEIDAIGGEVQAGDGNYPRTFAIAQLAVGDHVATRALVFEPRPSFRVANQPPVAAPASAASPPPPPPPGGAPTPQPPSVELPGIPVPPAVPPTAEAPPAQPPAPPTPPPPPASDGTAPLDLFTTVEGISVSPQTTVPPPPPPPVNPAPPGGARKEARQRQAAAQKSGADSAESESGREVEGQSDLAQDRPSPGGTSMSRHESAATRRERIRPAASITPLAGSEQPSTWVRGALYGGGVALLAGVLALGTSGRPTPRRRPSAAPAPALARSRRAR